MRVLHSKYQKLMFDKAWRKANQHNETSVGSYMFPDAVVTVGGYTYGRLNVQSLYATPDERLIIGNYVSIASDSLFLLGMNHPTDTFTTFPLRSKFVSRSSKDALSRGPIIIEDEVWIGSNAVIMSGVTIGRGAVIAAGSIVTKSVKPYHIVGGNPAKTIRRRFTVEVIEEMKKLKLIDIPVERIKKNIDLMYQRIETVEDVLRLQNILRDNI